MLKSIEGNFDNPEVNELLTKHFVELRAASPEGSAHVLDILGLKVPSIKFWSLWENEQIIGCGALKFLDEHHGEFKSIRIADKFKQKGLGIKIINHLINEAKELNVKKFVRMKSSLKFCVIASGEYDFDNGFTFSGGVSGKKGATELLTKENPGIWALNAAYEADTYGLSVAYASDIDNLSLIHI